MSDHLLPPNATSAERALSETIARIESVPIPIRDMYNPDTCPTRLLPWLAWAYSVDEWDPAWSELQQRQAIKASFDVHKHKGTAGAVKEAMAALGMSATIIEWHQQQPQGAPYTFNLQLEVSQDGIVLSDVDKLLAVITATKNLRSHLGTIDMHIQSQAQTSVAAVACIGSDITYAAPAGALLLDGTWSLDGSESINGIKHLFGVH